MSKSENYVKEIEPDFYTSEDVSAFDALFREYERVVFKSIFTAFGLDLFIKDQYGGDVDTIHNVRSVSDDSRMEYKSSVNAQAYEARGEYSHKDVEGAGTNFQRIKHDARILYGEDNRNNTVQDAYEDRPLGFLGKSKGRPTDKSAELDHVIAAKTIHDDRGRVLAGLFTKDLADAEDNLKWTNEHLNKSMGADEIPDYIAAHPELPDEVKERVMDAYNQAKASYEQKIFQSYYFDFSNPNCRKFYRETAVAAGKRGLQMGIRQAVGFLMTELWFSVKDELRICDGSIKGAFGAVCTGIKKWAVDVKENYKTIIAQFGEGFVSGIVSSLTATFTNIFITTSENTVRIIRQAWSSIVEATSILLFDTREKYFCDRMTSAAKVLAAGASMIVGTSVQQIVQTKLAELHVENELNKVISTFSGALCTGLLSVSLLFYIDNNPFGKFFEMVYGAKVEELKKQGAAFKKYCAELKSIELDRLEYETNYMYKLSSELSAVDGEGMNKLLKQALNDLGLPVLWGDGSLDDKMNDPAWVLHF